MATDREETVFGEAEETPAPRAGVRWGGVTEVPALPTPREESIASRDEGVEPPVEFGKGERLSEKRVLRGKSEIVEKNYRVEVGASARNERVGVSRLAVVATLGALLGLGATRLAKIRGGESEPFESRAKEQASASGKRNESDGVSPNGRSGSPSVSRPLQEKTPVDRFVVREAVRALLRGRCDEALGYLEKVPKETNEGEFALISGELCVRERKEVR